MVKDAVIKFVNKGSKFKNRNGAIVEVISDVDKLDQVTYKIKAKGSTFPDAKTVKVDSLISMLNQNGYIPTKDAISNKRVGTANSVEEAKSLILKSLKNHGPELRYMSSREANGNVWFSDTMGDSVGYYDKKSKNVYVAGDYVKYAVNVRDSSIEKIALSSTSPRRRGEILMLCHFNGFSKGDAWVETGYLYVDKTKGDFKGLQKDLMRNGYTADSSIKVEKFSFSSYTPERERKFENRLKELESNKNIKILSVSTVTDPVDKHFTNKEIRYIMKDALPRPPYYGPRGREVVREAENYLASKGYNNSTGKYDKVVQSVRSLLSQSYLEGKDFAKAVDQEVERLLKKYNLTSDREIPLSKMDTNALRDLAVSLGANRNKLYGTSKQALIIIINKLRSNKTSDSANGSVDDYLKKMNNKTQAEVEKILRQAKGNPNADKAYRIWKSTVKDADGMKEYNYSIRIGGDLRRVKVKANNASEALDKVKKEAIKFKMERVSTKFDNNKLSTRDLR